MARRLFASLVAVGVLVAIASPARAGISYVQLTGGSNRAAAFSWSEALFADGSATDAVLARDDLFADSLAAGALAGTTGGPLLLTDNDPADIQLDGELTRLGVTTIRILGGTAAVSQEMEDELVADGYTVERYAGLNRVQTAADLATDCPCYTTGPPSSTLYLARAFGDSTDATRAFADSLGAGMAAASELAPLMVTASDALSPEVRTWLETHTLLSNTVHVVGGTSAISDAVVDEIASLGFTVVRDAGVDRFATAVALAEISFRGPDRIVALVDGRDADGWVSAFAASAHGAGGAVVLADGDVLPDVTTEWLQANGPVTLYCGPDVAESTCAEANEHLNG